MSIGGAKRFDDVSRASFAAMADEAGMRPELVLGRLDRMAVKIVFEAHSLARVMESKWPSGIYEKIEGVIKDQVATVNG